MTPLGTVKSQTVASPPFSPPAVAGTPFSLSEVEGTPFSPSEVEGQQQPSA